MKIIEAYITFIIVFVIVKLKGIKHYSKYLDKVSFTPKQDIDEGCINTVRKSVDIATRFLVFYVDCVCRSLALAIMLRRRDIPAVVCLGVYSFPFGAHAWVEVSGMVVNDSAEYVRGFHRLERAQHHG